MPGAYDGRGDGSAILTNFPRATGGEAGHTRRHHDDCRVERVMRGGARRWDSAPVLGDAPSTSMFPSAITRVPIAAPALDKDRMTTMYVRHTPAAKPHRAKRSQEQPLRGFRVAFMPAAPFGPAWGGREGRAPNTEDSQWFTILGGARQERGIARGGTAHGKRATDWVDCHPGCPTQLCLRAKDDVMLCKSKPPGRCTTRQSKALQGREECLEHTAATLHACRAL